MKKLLFTAIGVVAFSGVSMANTVEVKESVLKVEVVHIQQDCAQKAIDIYEHVIGGGPDDLNLLNALIGMCN